jgi:hypothetical protein
MIAIVGIGLLAAAVPAAAHHAFAAEFDAEKPVKLQGTVTMVEWVNPHTRLHVDVKNPDGKVESWNVEGGSVNSLSQRGITRDSLKPGTMVVINGYQAKDGSRRANGRGLTIGKGQELFMGTTNQPGAPKDGRDSSVAVGTSLR